MSKRVGVYLRVSTLDQNTEIQRNDLVKYAKAREWEIVDIYEDKSSGTTTKKRPLFKKLMNDARERKFDIILVWKLDRFGRSLKDLVVHLQELSELGVDFVSLKDGLDFSTSVGRLMCHILASFAEFEASVIRERVKAGVRAKIEKTGHWGRIQTRDDERILALKDEGHSNRAVARMLEISETTVRRSLLEKL